MRLRTLILALALSSGLATAVDAAPAGTNHVKKVKPVKHAKPPKAAKRVRTGTKATAHKSPKVAKHPSGRKVAKHKGRKVSKHKA